VSHRFSLLATTRGVSYGVDSFSEVGGIEVLKTFIKKIDTGVNSVIVRGAASASEEAERLAKEYGITILGRDELGGFFEQMDVNTLISQSSGRWPRS
jgi:predicted RNase H-like nuclease (RuvC/YqgF family)